MEYDIVIVGAGPGGLNCARFLEKRYKVLVLEKNNIIGDKVCAGGLTIHSFRYLNLPKKYIEHSFDSVYVNSPRRRVRVKMDFPYLFMIDRKILARWQQSKLKSTKLMTGSKVTAITKSYVEVNEKHKIKYKYLIGADGSASAVRKYLGLPSRSMLAFHYLIKNSGINDAEVYFDGRKFGSWYSWIFPHKESVSIGTGGDPNAIPIKLLKRNLDLWLKEKGIDIKGARFESFPINSDYRGYDFGNVFLVGDAAGLASGLTGEGIYQALISGETVARKILWEKCNLDGVLKRKKRHDRILRLLRLSKIRNLEIDIFLFLLRNKRISNLLIEDVI